MTDTYLTIAGFLSPFLIVILGGLGWLVRHEREKRAQLEARLNEAKAKIYHNVIVAFASMFSKEIKNGKPIPPSEKKVFEILEAINDFSRQGLVYAPKSVMDAHANFVRHFFDNADAPSEKAIENLSLGMEKFTLLVNAIREDLGHEKKRSNFTTDDLGRIFINDYKGQFSNKVPRPSIE